MVPMSPAYFFQEVSLEESGRLFGDAKLCMVDEDSQGQRMTVLSSCRYRSKMERKMSIHTIFAGGLDAVLGGIVILYLMRGGSGSKVH